MMKMSQNVDGLTSKRSNIVEQILEQGQRLRNAMVKSILDNDPFYVDSVDTNNIKNSIKTKTHSGTINYQQPETVEKFSLNSRKAKEASTVTLKPASCPKVMSAYFPDNYCPCDICNIYKREISTTKCQHILPLHLLDRTKCNKFQNTASHDYDSEDIECTGPSTNISRNNLQSGTLKSDHAESKTHSNQIRNPSIEITRSIQESYRSKAAEYFKYIDSLKVTVHSLSLNLAGNKKAATGSADYKYKLPTSYSHSYFVEYNVPDCLINTLSKSNSKVDSGLSSNLYRVCSKKLQNEEIYFKHTSIHDIVSLLTLNLNTIDIKFQVSSRTMKQKRANVLGYAIFNMGLFEITKNVCCTEDFPIISEDFVLGTIKITLQLGCGRMYFGKEFVDFINTNRKDSVSTVMQKTDVSTINTPSSQTVHSVVFQNKAKEEEEKRSSKSSGNFRKEPPQPKSFVQETIINKVFENDGFASSTGTLRSEIKNTSEDNDNFCKNIQTAASTDIIDINHKIILYGLIYVSEAKYFEAPINSYLSSQAFCLGDTLCSRVVYNSKDPVFNFYQKVPFLYDSSFLNYLQNNSIGIDFWERYEDEDIAIGTSQLSLYQFYVTYKNKIITNTLIQNRLPVTIADWWEPICSPVNGKLYGQMKVLVAVGTATQIQNLEIERGLKDESLSVTYVPIVPEAGSQKQPVVDATKSNNDILGANNRSNLFKRPNYLNKPIKEQPQQKNFQSAANIDKRKPVKSISLNNNTPIVNKKDSPIKVVDKGVQSDIRMESQDKAVEKTVDNTQNILEAFLTKLIEQKQRSKYVENATNTENGGNSKNLTKNENDNKEETCVRESIKNSNPAKNAEIKKTSDLLDYLNGSLGLGSGILNPDVESKDEDNFKAHIVVEGALHLPCRRKCKVKKTRKKNVSYEESLPSTYVTFETIPGVDLKITPAVFRSANPQWDYRCDVLLPGDVLTNSQKRLIFKVWRKSNPNIPQPNLQSDLILGFAALDLTVLLAGLPSVQGWFNIVDFSSKCNGQIKIHVTPLENISRFNESKPIPLPQVDRLENNLPIKSTKNFVPSTLLDIEEPPGELLSRALKRKFTELEEITQRLRSRLADVTKDDSDISNDEFADEFERDINTLSVEDDYNTVNLKSLTEQNRNLDLQSFSAFENGASNYLLKEANYLDTNNEPSIYSKGIFHSESLPKGALSDSAYGSTQTGNVSNRYATETISPSSCGLMLDNKDFNPSSHILTPRDKQLIAGKQQINCLLEKLSLLTGANVDNSFPNRYVSGCSLNQESEVPMRADKFPVNDDESRSGLNLDSILNTDLFNHLCSANLSTPSLTESDITERGHGSSTNTLSTQFSNYRQAPDGAGNFNTSTSSNSNSFNLN